LKSGLESAAAKPDDPALAAKRKEIGEAAARLHAKLLELALTAKSAERADAALTAEIALDPDGKNAHRDLGVLLKAALDHRWNEVAGKWLARARTLDPTTWAAGRYRDAQVELGKRDLIVLGGAEHPLAAFVALPAAWTPAKKGLPILVAVEGAGCNFAGCCRSYRDGRGAREAIVATPCSLSNTNGLEAAKYPWYDAATLAKYQKPGEERVKFDAAGVEALLAEVRRDWGANASGASEGCALLPRVAALVDRSQWRRRSLPGQRCARGVDGEWRGDAERCQPREPRGRRKRPESRRALSPAKRARRCPSSDAARARRS
jgi:hypothetical protein